jgi:hypothetical protein
MNSFMFNPRGLNQLIEDFKKATGNFLNFYNGMDSREKLLFQGWIYKMRTEVYSPLSTSDEPSSYKLF